MKGWMTKKGAVRKNWSRRWFELRGTSLVYYKDEHATSSSKKGQVDLSRCLSVQRAKNPDARPFEFEVVSAHRVYRFASEDETDLAAWLQAIASNLKPGTNEHISS